MPYCFCHSGGSGEDYFSTQFSSFNNGILRNGFTKSSNACLQKEMSLYAVDVFFLPVYELV